MSPKKLLRFSYNCFKKCNFTLLAPNIFVIDRAPSGEWVEGSGEWERGVEGRGLRVDGGGCRRLKGEGWRTEGGEDTLSLPPHLHTHTHTVG